MREFKVIRMNVARTALYDDYLMFKDMETADTWAMERNKKFEGNVVDITEVPGQDELKYEY